ncbi:MAG: tRNA (adenosine(37)-N6)-dimethylallyltransferase MiaA [Chloroflexi bacterium]|nr:tRNA (adenosine(37)-N6)-dimethylallyltransferase MiaA [Chloroflexota bacterium]
MDTPILVIVGPTAVGKSALALRLATAVGGEIVSADSRQVYRHMDIGTAKPSPDELAAVPHHLIDVADPDEDYSLAVFLRQAREAIQNVKNRGRLPILAGGTGQYVWGLLEGWQVPEVAPDAELRRRLEGRAESEGADTLYAELSQLNPEAASRIDPRNVRRVIRALEVSYSSPESANRGMEKSPPPYDAKLIGLTMPRRTLYRRIDDRVDAMMEAGFLDETRRLLEMGYGPELPSMSSVGYRELAMHLEGKLSLDEAVQRIKYGTHRIARHQYAWFRLGDERVAWFDVSDGFEEAMEEAMRWARAKSM